MYSKIIFTILIFTVNFEGIFGQLSCNYIVDVYNGYTCYLSVNNPTGLNNFASISGTHVSGYTDSHVARIIADYSGSISTNIPSIICSKFTNVQRMDLDSIGIQRIDDYSFISCTAMNFLNVIYNQISTVHERAFNRNVNLQTLYLFNNRLTTLPENVFQYQQSLITLALGSNRFADLPGKIFWPLTNLQTLDLRFNQLRNIRPEWFENLQSLTSLAIFTNGFTDFPKNAFSQLKNLTTLYASENNLKMIHADSFGFLPNIRYIDFYASQINAIDENLIDYTGVQHIDMRGNFCANKEIRDTSISRDIMRAELRECFNNYERTMSVCRQHSKLFIESDKAQTCVSDKQDLREEAWVKEKEEMKEAWAKEKKELLTTIKKLSTNENRKS